MKIAVLADTFPPYMSGVTTNCVELAKQLLTLGHEVLILTSKNGKPFVPKGLEKAKIVYLPSFKVPGFLNFTMCLPNAVKVLYHLRLFKAEAVDAQGPSFLGVDGLMACKLLGIPLVSRFTTLVNSEDYLRTIFKIKEVGFIKVAVDAYVGWFYKSSDLVVAETASSKDHLIRLGVSEEKIAVTPSLFAFSSIKYLSADDKLKLKKKYSLKKNVAVFHGRASKEKRLDVLVKIWALVVATHKDSSLLIIGDGVYLAELKQLVKKMGLGPYVVFAGNVPNNQLIETGLLGVGDVYVSASTSETFGISGAEAMAHRLPVVLARSQGLCEIVANGGFVCESEDLPCFAEKITKLFDNPSLRSQMGESAYAVADSIAGPSAVEGFITNYKRARNKLH